MNSKRFEYTHKDLPYLKKDIVYRTCFIVLFLSVFVWQFGAMIKAAMSDSLFILQICSSVLVFITCLLLSFISLLYVFKDFRIIAAVKMNGKCVSAVQMLIRTNKRSFLWLYNLLIQFLTLVTAIILICSITYAILQATYLATISYYLPFLVAVCLSGFNSIYHIRDEIRVQNTVQEFHNA